MAFENLGRLRFARLPERDLCVFARRHETAVGQDRDRVHRAFVKAHHLLGGVFRKRPADRRGVEAAGKRLLAVGGNRERAHRAAMAAQLCVSNAGR
jgi:hypothetical protein